VAEARIHTEVVVVAAAAAAAAVAMAAAAVVVAVAAVAAEAPHATDTATTVHAAETARPLASLQPDKDARAASLAVVTSSTRIQSGSHQQQFELSMACEAATSATLPMTREGAATTAAICLATLQTMVSFQNFQRRLDEGVTVPHARRAPMPPTLCPQLRQLPQPRPTLLLRGPLHHSRKEDWGWRDHSHRHFWWCRHHRHPMGAGSRLPRAAVASTCRHSVKRQSHNRRWRNTIPPVCTKKPHNHLVAPC